MDKTYFVEKLEELNNNNKSKIKPIIEILIKCEEHENIIEDKIKFLIEEHQHLLLLEKKMNDLFNNICDELNN
jgi:hypothetical protein